jgi:hypothetical protein
VPWRKPVVFWTECRTSAKLPSVNLIDLWNPFRDAR